MTDPSLKLLVVNTLKIDPETLEPIMRASDYDVIVLIPALRLRSNAKYVIGDTQNYTLCINRNRRNYPNIVPVEGVSVHGIRIPQFSLLVLSVDTDVEESFVPKVKELYPHQTFLVVHRSFPTTVFDIQTGDRPTVIHNNPTSFGVVTFHFIER